MKDIKRDLKLILDSNIGKGKVLLLIGPRQVGKTTLLKQMIKSFSAEKKVQFWNCDESDIRQFLSDGNLAKLKSFIGNSDFIVIDEAQRVKDIGLTIKLIHDNFANVQLAVTGSSLNTISSHFLLMSLFKILQCLTKQNNFKIGLYMVFIPM